MTLVCKLAGMLTTWLLVFPVQGPVVKDPETERLIQQLGDSLASKRDAAFLSLKKRGPQGLPTLRLALSSTDPTIRRSVEVLVPMLEKQAESAEVLRPTRVKLAYQNTPLNDVLQDLQRQTSYRFMLADQDKDLALKTVTLTTEEIPLWEALDRLSRHAHLQWSPGMNAMLTTRDQINPAKGRARQYAPQGAWSSATQNNVIGCSAGQSASNDICTLGAVRCVLQETGAAYVPPVTNTAVERRAQQGAAPAKTPVPPVRPPMAGQGLRQGAAAERGGLPPKDRVQQEVVPSRTQTRNKTGEEKRAVHTLNLAILSEPKIQWLGELQVRTEPLLDDQMQEIDFLGVGEEAAGVGAQTARIQQFRPQGNLPNIVQMQEGVVAQAEAGSRGKQEISLRCRLPEQPGEVIPSLRGCIVGKVRTPMEPIVEIPDIPTAGLQTFKGKGDVELRLVHWGSSSKTQHRVVVELISPGALVNPWMVQNQIQVQVNNRAQMRGNVGGGSIDSPDLVVTDDKGRVMSVTGRGESNLAGKPGQRITLLLKSEDETSIPKKLVHLGSRIVDIEVPFEFKNVKLK